MKQLASILLILVLSCNYFETKKISSQDIVNQELKTINWNEVDEYPSFSSCDSVSGKEQRKLCFETTILNHVNLYLSQQQIVVSKNVEDTIHMKIQIDKKGTLHVLDIKTASKTKVLLPEIDSLLLGSVTSLPKIFPATKRGQQVSTEYVLPIQLVIK